MPTDNLAVLAMSLVAGCLPAIIVLAAALRLRAVLGRRLQRLEDALRVYNGANADLGRQLREMEEQFKVPAPRSAAARGVEAPRPAQAATRSPEPQRFGDVLRAAANPATSTSAPRREALRTDSEFTESELKLARLLKSRLPAMRIG